MLFRDQYLAIKWNSC